MSILNSIPGIGSLGSSVVSFLLFVAESLGTSLSMERIGKLLLTKLRARCLGCCVCGRFPRLVHFSLFLILFAIYEESILGMGSSCFGHLPRHRGF